MELKLSLLLPHIPDKWYAFAVAQTYYEELISAGVQIYEYTPGFVHAKVFVSDNDTATVGTINLDYRSLYHHFECGTFIYNNPVVWEIERDFQNTLKACQKITMLDVKARRIGMKMVGRVLRLIATFDVNKYRKKYCITRRKYSIILSVLYKQC